MPAASSDPAQSSNLNGMSTSCCTNLPAPPLPGVILTDTGTIGGGTGRCGGGPRGGASRVVVVVTPVFDAVGMTGLVPAGLRTAVPVVCPLSDVVPTDTTRSGFLEALIGLMLTGTRGVGVV